MKSCEVRVKTSPSGVACSKALCSAVWARGYQQGHKKFQLPGSAELCSQCAISDGFVHQNHRFLKNH